MNIQDGTRLGNQAGHLVEVVDPPWWRIDRWISWWRTPSSDRAMMHLGRWVRVRIERRLKLVHVPDSAVSEPPFRA